MWVSTKGNVFSYLVLLILKSCPLGVFAHPPLPTRVWPSTSVASSESERYLKDDVTSRESSGRNIRPLSCQHRESGQIGVCMFAWDCMKVNGTHLGTCIDRFYFGSCCDLGDRTEQVIQSLASQQHASMRPPLRPVVTTTPPTTTTLRPITELPEDMKLSTAQVVHQGPGNPALLDVNGSPQQQRPGGVKCPPELEFICGTSTVKPEQDGGSTTKFPILPGFPEWGTLPTTPSTTLPPVNVPSPSTPLPEIPNPSVKPPDVPGQVPVPEVPGVAIPENPVTGGGGNNGSVADSDQPPVQTTPQPSTSTTSPPQQQPGLPMVPGIQNPTLPQQPQIPGTPTIPGDPTQPEIPPVQQPQIPGQPELPIQQPTIPGQPELPVTLPPVGSSTTTSQPPTNGSNDSPSVPTPTIPSGLPGGLPDGTPVNVTNPQPPTGLPMVPGTPNLPIQQPSIPPVQIPNQPGATPTTSPTTVAPVGADEDQPGPGSGIIPGGGGTPNITNPGLPNVTPIPIGQLPNATVPAPTVPTNLPVTLPSGGGIPQPSTPDLGQGQLPVNATLPGQTSSTTTQMPPMEGDQPGSGIIPGGAPNITNPALPSVTPIPIEQLPNATVPTNLPVTLPNNVTPPTGGGVTPPGGITNPDLGQLPINNVTAPGQLPQLSSTTQTPPVTQGDEPGSGIIPGGGGAPNITNPIGQLPNAPNATVPAPTVPTNLPVTLPNNVTPPSGIPQPTPPNLGQDQLPVNVTAPGQLPQLSSTTPQTPPAEGDQPGSGIIPEVPAGGPNITNPIGQLPNAPNATVPAPTVPTNLPVTLPSGGGVTPPANPELGQLPGLGNVTAPGQLPQLSSTTQTPPVTQGDQPAPGSGIIPGGGPNITNPGIPIGQLPNAPNATVPAPTVPTNLPVTLPSGGGVTPPGGIPQPSTPDIGQGQLPVNVTLPGQMSSTTQMPPMEGDQPGSGIIPGGAPNITNPAIPSVTPIPIEQLPNAPNATAPTVPSNLPVTLPNNVTPPSGGGVTPPTGITNPDLGQLPINNATVPGQFPQLSSTTQTPPVTEGDQPGIVPVIGGPNITNPAVPSVTPIPVDQLPNATVPAPSVPTNLPVTLPSGGGVTPPTGITNPDLGQLPINNVTAPGQLPQLSSTTQTPPVTQGDQPGMGLIPEIPVAGPNLTNPAIPAVTPPPVEQLPNATVPAPTVPAPTVPANLPVTLPNGGGVTPPAGITQPPTPDIGQGQLPINVTAPPPQLPQLPSSTTTTTTQAPPAAVAEDSPSIPVFPVLDPVSNISSPSIPAVTQPTIPEVTQPSTPSVTTPGVTQPSVPAVTSPTIPEITTPIPVSTPSGIPVNLPETNATFPILTPPPIGGAPGGQNDETTSTTTTIGTTTTKKPAIKPPTWPPNWPGIPAVTGSTTTTTTISPTSNLPDQDAGSSSTVAPPSSLPPLPSWTIPAITITSSRPPTAADHTTHPTLPSWTWGSVAGFPTITWRPITTTTTTSEPTSTSTTSPSLPSNDFPSLGNISTPSVPTGLPLISTTTTSTEKAPSSDEQPGGGGGLPGGVSLPSGVTLPSGNLSSLPTTLPTVPPTQIPTIPGQLPAIPGQSTTTTQEPPVKQDVGGTTVAVVQDEDSTFFSENGTLLINDYKKICGRRFFPTSRIVGGKEATYGKWPWQISLRQWRTSTYLHKCGAALLNENWAITAAHCVEKVPPTDLLLRIGEFDLSEEKEPYGYVERRVQIVATHPQFDARTFEYDLALLRFYEPVTFQPNIVPICVPENDEDYLGKTGYVTGWGRLYEDGPLPSRLQEVPVPVINNEACESMYRAAGYIEHIPHIFICAGWRSGGKDSCEGDSGGPMVLQRDSDNRWNLGGIISWGIGCAEPNQPGVYTRISEFRNWINQILQF